MRARLRKIDVTAWQVEEHNLEHLAEAVNGAVKGIKLPRKDQVIQFWSKERDEELEAKVGDWIVRFYHDYKEAVVTEVYPDKMFHEIFRETGETQ